MAVQTKTDIGSGTMGEFPGPPKVVIGEFSIAGGVEVELDPLLEEEDDEVPVPVPVVVEPLPEEEDEPLDEEVVPVMMGCTSSGVRLTPPMPEPRVT